MAMTKVMEIDLPALPQPAFEADEDIPEDCFNEEQMLEYARRAVIANREQRNCEAGR